MSQRGFLAQKIFYGFVVLFDVVKTVSPVIEVESMFCEQIRSLTGETAMTLYIGVDFHPHRQTIAWCETGSGELKIVELLHEVDSVRKFYSSFPFPAVIGMEASAKAIWFEKLVSESGHKLLVGDPVKIRKRATSRHKNDRRDAELILELLMRDEFPALWRRPPESEQVLEILRLRSNLVRQRTQVYNRLQALAHNAGLPKGRMRTLLFQATVRSAEMDESGALSRAQYFALLGALNARIAELEEWLEKKSRAEVGVALLQSQKGVGSLTALVVFHTLGDVTRFKRISRQVVGFAGLDPVERSSAGRIRFGQISKAGPALLRFYLGQSAQMATRSDAKLKSFYKRLSKKKPKAVAKTAAARKLLVKLAIMLRDKITAEEFDRRGRTVGNARLSAGSEMTVDLIGKRQPSSQ
jgi:transposase